MQTAVSSNDTVDVIPKKRVVNLPRTTNNTPKVTPHKPDSVASNKRHKAAGQTQGKAVAHAVTSAAPQFQHIQDHQVVVGDPGRRKNRTTPATDIAIEVKEEFLENYRGKKKASWIPLAIKETEKRIWKTFPQSKGKNLTVVKCNKNTTDRTVSTNTHGYSWDKKATYGIGKPKEALEFFFDSRDPPKQENAVAKYRAKLNSLDRSKFPRHELRNFEKTLRFFEKQQKAEETCAMAKNLLTSLPLIPAFEKQWATLMSLKIKDGAGNAATSLADCAAATSGLLQGSAVVPTPHAGYETGKRLPSQPAVAQLEKPKGRAETLFPLDYTEHTAISTAASATHESSSTGDLELFHQILVEEMGMHPSTAGAVNYSSLDDDTTEDDDHPLLEHDYFSFIDWNYLPGFCCGVPEDISQMSQGQSLSEPGSELGDATIPPHNNGIDPTVPYDEHQYAHQRLHLPPPSGHERSEDESTLMLTSIASIPESFDGSGTAEGSAVHAPALLTAQEQFGLPIPAALPTCPTALPPSSPAKSRPRRLRRVTRRQLRMWFWKKWLKRASSTRRAAPSQE